MVKFVRRILSNSYVVDFFFFVTENRTPFLMDVLSYPVIVHFFRSPPLFRAVLMFVSRRPVARGGVLISTETRWTEVLRVNSL